MKEADKQIIRELNRIHDAVSAGSGAPAFADITGDPSDNSNLAAALDAKQSEAEVQTIADGKVADTAYDATSWDGVTGIAPSKNAVRDKIESLSIPAAPSDTAYDATSWDGVTTIAPSKNAVRDKIEAVVASIPPAHSGGVIGTANVTCDADGDPTLTVNNVEGILTGWTVSFTAGTLDVAFLSAEPNAFYGLQQPIFDVDAITARIGTKTSSGFTMVSNIANTPVTFDIIVMRISQ